MGCHQYYLVDQGVVSKQMPPNLTRDEQKRIMKEALKEWLNEQFAAFGKFALSTIVVLAFTFLVWVYFASHGFKFDGK